MGRHPTHSEEPVKHLPSIKRPARTATIALASAAAGMALTLPGLALAGHGAPAVPAPPAAPTSADQIQNVDQVRTAIKAYYGDTPTNVDDPVPAGQDAAVLGDSVVSKLHQFGADSAYAHEVKGIAAKARHFLAERAHHHGKGHHHQGAPSILFDIDDTTLNTFSYEIYSNFVFNPTTNGFFVNAGSASVFPAVPGMVDLEKAAEAKGYDVYFLTGRPISQTAGTLANLTDAGYDVDPSHVFLKDTTAATEPWLAPCVDPTTHAFTCTTIQYKSLTRQHIEQDLGADIVANFGDQFSDLTGGFADRTFKIPNPMYFLP
jgi:putative acid phosphatase of HAD superfamily subfamily IIIB